MIYHVDTEARSELLHADLTKKIIGAAIEVHRALGPGLLESAYEECLCREFNLRGLAFQRQMALPIEYKGVKLDCGYRLDMVVQCCGSGIEVFRARPPGPRSAVAYVSQTNR